MGASGVTCPGNRPTKGVTNLKGKHIDQALLGCCGVAGMLRVTCTAESTTGCLTGLGMPGEKSARMLALCTSVLCAVKQFGRLVLEVHRPLH